MIKLAAFDLDGTLLTPDLTITPRVRQAIDRAMAQGVIVTLATGRGPTIASEVARDVGLNAPLVVYQGGMVTDHVAGRVLFETRLPQACLPRVVAAAGAHDLHLHFEESGYVYLSKTPPPAIFQELYRRVDYQRQVDDLLTGLPGLPHKFIVTVSHPDKCEATAATLRTELNGDPPQVTIVISHPYLVEGLPAGVDKAVGLAWLAQRLGIPPDQVMAVGDNDNDAGMLAWAGLGVAMGNGSAAALAAAKAVVPSSPEDGAAVALERFVLARC